MKINTSKNLLIFLILLLCASIFFLPITIKYFNLVRTETKWVTNIQPYDLVSSKEDLQRIPSTINTPFANRIKYKKIIKRDSEGWFYQGIEGVFNNKEWMPTCNYHLTGSWSFRYDISLTKVIYAYAGGISSCVIAEQVFKGKTDKEIYDNPNKLYDTLISDNNGDSVLVTIDSQECSNAFKEAYEILNK